MRINRLTCSGLFSYTTESTIRFSGRTVIVGPNNAGKSNIFRIIRILMDALGDNRDLSAFEMSRTKNKAFVEAEIALSPKERSLLAEFFRYYVVSGYPLRVAGFQSAALGEFLTEIVIRVDWTKDIRGFGINPRIRVSFPKCGFKLSGSRRASGLAVSGINEPDLERWDNSIDFHEFCARFLLEKHPKDGFKDFTVDGKTPVHRAIDFKDNAINNMESAKDIESAIEFKRRLRPRDRIGNLSVPLVLGLIMSRKIAHASSIGCVAKPFSKVYEHLRQSKDNIEFALWFNQTAEEMLRAMDLEDSPTLNDDGSNMARFLFTLKNSPNRKSREAFGRIQAGFAVVFDKKLRVDVVLRYKQSQAGRSEAGFRVPSFPEITFVDTSLPGSATLGQVGAGALQVLSLLAASHGMKGSVVMLDEPGINLHPSMLQTVMDEAGSGEENQTLIVTHLPDLLEYEAFGRNSDIVYVKNSGGTSSIRGSWDNDKLKWWDKDRKNLRHQIDTSVFFSNLAILVEGPSDKSVLSGVAEYKAGEDKNYDLARRNIVVVDVGGKGNFAKYAKLLDAYEIAYVILADRDDDDWEKPLENETSDFPSDCQDKIDADIVLIEKDLEHLLRSIDERAFEDAKKGSRKSKVAAAIKFCQIVQKEPQKLCRLTAFLDYCIGRASGA